MQYIWKETHLGILIYTNEWIFLQTSLEDMKIGMNGCDISFGYEILSHLEKITEELVEWWSIKRYISNPY